MFVTTATIGASFRNDPSLSSLFDHQIIALAEARVGAAHHADASADDDRRIEIRRGSGSAAIMDVVVVFPWLPATAMPNFWRISSARSSPRGITGNCQPPRFHHFRIIGAHSGADHHGFGSGRDSLPRAPSIDHGSARGEPLRDGRALEIGTADRVPQFEQHFGQSAHADPADTDEVNVLALEKHFNFVLFRLSGLLSNARFRHKTPPPDLPKSWPRAPPHLAWRSARAALAIASSNFRSAASCDTSSTSRAPVI